jgi:Ca2+-binding RTX toxin-like protein
LRSYTGEEVSITSLLLRVTEHPTSDTEKSLMAIYNGTSARNIWNGTASADTAHGNGGDDSFYGKGGNDTLYGDVGNDGLYGDDGNDTLWGGDGVDALTGGSGADTLRGGNGDDYILGGIGDDGLYGDAGNDRLRGEDGIDALFGGAGIDDLQGGNGNDYLDGGTENDTLNGGAGNDRLRGGDGNDSLNGSTGNNDLAGGAGNDTLVHTDIAGPSPITAPGKSVFDGGTGYDTLLLNVQGQFQYEGLDHGYTTIIQGTDGAGSMLYNTDPFNGSYVEMGTFRGIEEFRLTDTSNPFDFVSRADAKIVGGNGDDVITAGAGNQTLTGGGAADFFIFRFFEGDTNAGHDFITGFNVAEGDRISFDTIADEQFPEPPFKITGTEANGFTTYTSTDIDTGAVVHEVTIDAVGLPPDGYFG